MTSMRRRTILLFLAGLSGNVVLAAHKRRLDEIAGQREALTARNTLSDGRNTLGAAATDMFSHSTDCSDGCYPPDARSNSTDNQ